MKFSFAKLLANSRVKIPTAIVLFLLVISAFQELCAQGYTNVATQTVTMEVKPISRISVAGNPGQLIIKDEARGTAPSVISDDNTKYSLSTNVGNMKIVASINDRMPAGTKLMIRLASSKAASEGVVDLSNAMTPVNVVTGIGKGVESNQTISYTFAANAEVQELPATSRTITLTLTN